MPLITDNALLCNDKSELYAFDQDNVHFSVQAAEKITFNTNQFDLVNVA